TRPAPPTAARTRSQAWRRDTTAVTSAPRAASSLTTCGPTKPPAPVTSTRRSRQYSLMAGLRASRRQTALAQTFQEIGGTSAVGIPCEAPGNPPRVRARGRIAEHVLDRRAHALGTAAPDRQPHACACFCHTLRVLELVPLHRHHDQRHARL